MEEDLHSKMEKRKITSEGYFRTLRILFVGMLMSQLTFVGTMIYLHMTNGLPIPDANLTLALIYALIVLGSLGLGASFFLVNMLIAKATDKPALSEKLRGYQTASIIRYALLEAPSLLGTIGFWLTGEYLFFIATGAAIVVFLLAIPSKLKVTEALRLTYDEVQLLNDAKAIVAEFEVSSAD